MKRIWFIWSFMIVAIACVSCSDSDDSLPSEEEFADIVDEFLYRSYKHTYLVKNGDEWVETDFFLVGGPSNVEANSKIWFKDGMICTYYSSVTISNDDEFTSESVEIYVRSEYTYNSKTGEISTANNILSSYESSGDRFFISNVTKTSFTIMTEFAERFYDSVDGTTADYVIITPPSSGEYVIFDSENEAKEYYNSCRGAQS